MSEDISKLPTRHCTGLLSAECSAQEKVSSEKATGATCIIDLMHQPLFLISLDTVEFDRIKLKVSSEKRLRDLDM